MGQGSQRIPVLGSLFVVLSLGWIYGAAEGQSSFQASFLHGVASGDPTPEGVIVWTRITPRDSVHQLPIPVQWYVADKASALPTDPQSAASFPLENDKDVAQGEHSASPDSDFTVKVDVRGLEPGRTFFYVFLSGISRSPIGRFKVPLPQGQQLDSLRIATFSCANWGWGYFNGYDLAARYDLDAWIHVGDFIYEYDDDHYPHKHEAVRGWGLEPKHEIITLQDYRLRHATYRSDKGLQALAASAALIATWDDHEIANNPWKDGAQNHNAGEGSWIDRKTAAVQAYHEWLPTRDKRNGDNSYIGPLIYRKMEFGNLMSFLILESRLLARTSGETDPFPDTDENGDGIPDNDDPSTAAMARAASIIGQTPPSRWDSSSSINEAFEQLRQSLEAYRRDDTKKLLGEDQLSWIQQQIAQSKAAGTKWQVVGQQIILADRMWNIDAAIDSKEAQGDHATAALWREVIMNVTLWDCESIPQCLAASDAPTFRFKDPTAYNRNWYNLDLPVSASTAQMARMVFSLQKYKVPNYFDDWEGYFAARERFLESLSAAEGTAVVYGGDSHNAWASEHFTSQGQTVCGEFDVTSVTSTGNENFIPIVPQEMLEQCFVSGNRDHDEGGSYFGELRYTEQANRGFSLFTLTHDVHHAEFIYVDTIASEEYFPFKCDAFDYSFDELEHRYRMKAGSCTQIPKAKPYEFNGLLPSHLCGCAVGECAHGCRVIETIKEGKEEITPAAGEAGPGSRKPNDFAPLLGALVGMMSVVIVFLYLKVNRLSKTVQRFHSQTDEDLDGDGFL